jgi:hypothetical protein
VLLLVVHRKSFSLSVFVSEPPVSAPSATHHKFVSPSHPASVAPSNSATVFPAGGGAPAWANDQPQTQSASQANFMVVGFTIIVEDRKPMSLTLTDSSREGGMEG